MIRGWIARGVLGEEGEDDEWVDPKGAASLGEGEQETAQGFPGARQQN